MSNGNIPFLGASETNFGITGFTDIDTITSWDKVGNDKDFSTQNKLFGPNCFAITNNGSVGNVYFMETQYTSSHDVTTLYLKYDVLISKELGLFLSTLLKMAGKHFSYGRKWRPKRMRKTKMMLPVLDDNSPHWDFMEQYIVNLMNKIDTPKLTLPVPSNISLTSVDWKEFRISDVMDVLSGVRLTTSDMTTGDIPFIGATDSNNGITNWTSDTNASTDSNVLGVNYNGSVGETFYHPYTATFSDDVKRLKIKEYNVQSKEVYLFIKTMILQQKEKYAYGYKFNGNRMKAQKIMLPITKDKDINWQFMEDYIKSISNSHLI